MSGSRWITSISHHVNESKVTHTTTKTEARNIAPEKICIRETTEVETILRCQDKVPSSSCRGINGKDSAWEKLELHGTSNEEGRCA